MKSGTTLGFFNLQHASFAFINVGATIFVINLIGGTFPSALQAGILQGFLSFSIVGLNTQFFRYIYDHIDVALSILLPSLVTTSISFALHTFNQSNQPVLSAIAVFFMAMVNFSILAKVLKELKTIDLLSIGKFCLCFFQGKKK